MKDQSPLNPAGNAVTGNFQLQAQMPNGKAFSVSGYLFDGESVESVNSRLDLLHGIVDRVRMRAEIPELEAKLDQRIIQLGQLKDAIAASETKSTTTKLSSQEKLNLTNWMTSVSKINEDIDKGRAEIARNKAAVGLA